jgi:hypothetical protein
VQRHELARPSMARTVSVSSTTWASVQATALILPMLAIVCAGSSLRRWVLEVCGPRRIDT